jgi:hypothetical protein
MTRSFQISAPPLELFIDDVVWSDKSDYRQLLLADHLLLNQRLAKFYGVKVEGEDEFSKVSFDPRQRSGVLTHPFLLSAFAYHKSSSPIHRGVFLTRNIVGRALKPPPMAIEFMDGPFRSQPYHAREGRGTDAPPPPVKAVTQSLTRLASASRTMTPLAAIAPKTTKNPLTPPASTAPPMAKA